MSLTAFLEVAIGLVFTYLFLSLIATWVNETIAGIFRLRANDLKKAIQDLLEDPEKVKNAPYNSVVHKIDHSTLDDPEKWAITWRAYLKKHKKK